MTHKRTYFILFVAVVLTLSAVGYRMLGQVSFACGNGRIDAKEQCDDANGVDTDGCTKQCMRQVPENVKEMLPYDTYFLDAWREQLTHPRGSLTTQTGLRYDPVTRTWSLQPAASGTGDIAHGAYNITYVMESAVNAAEATQDPEIMEGISQFYLDYFRLRFTTLGQMRSEVRAKPLTLTGVLINMNPNGTLKSGADPDATKTITWYEPISHPNFKFRVRECKLCMMQFYISPARFIRVIATLPAAKRTPLMQQFVSAYAPTMVNDHLLRYDTWLKGQWSLPPGQRLIGDTDMMQMSAIADILGANKHDPALVPLTSETRERLMSLLVIGINAVKARANYHTDTKDWAGNTVGSMDLFEGDYDSYVDYRYANYSGPIPPLPDPATLTRPVKAGYDIAHAWRFPQTLRSLYDNRDLLSLPFPTAEDMRLLSNQYAYKVFKGDLRMPQLNNFMDGRDTWYRVGYGASYVGLAPTQYCYTFDREFKNGAYHEDRAQKYPCLGGFNGRIGWGRLAEFQPDLKKVVLATLDLLSAKEPDRVAFRERYLSYGNNEPFQIWEAGLRTTPDNNPWFMLLPFALFSDLSNPVTVPIVGQQALRPSAGIEILPTLLPDDTHVNPACGVRAFSEDAAVCLNALIDAHQGSNTLTIQIASGTYMMRTQTITLFNKKNVHIVGVGATSDNTILKMSPAAARNRNDLYFMVQTFNGSNITLSNLTLDGSELSGQRGIGVCALPFQTARNVTVRGVNFRNMALYGMIAGNIYSEGLVNVPERGAYPALTQTYTYLRSLPTTQRYCSGNISGITFENNKVDIGTPKVALKSMGFVLVPYTSKQPLGDRTVTTANWSEIARSLARRNANITIRNNAFRGWSHESDSGIRIQSANNIVIAGNSFTDAGYTKAFRTGGQINIGQNVWNADVSSNRLYLSAKNVDPARGIVLANGFDQHSLYGYGKGLGLSSPSMNVTVRKNSLSNARIRLADCCLATNASVSAYCTNTEALRQLENENLVITGNTNISPGTQTTSLIWQNSTMEPGKPWTAVCRANLNATISE